MEVLLFFRLSAHALAGWAGVRTESEEVPYTLLGPGRVCMKPKTQNLDNANPGAKSCFF